MVDVYFASDGETVESTSVRSEDVVSEGGSYYYEADIPDGHTISGSDSFEGTVTGDVKYVSASPFNSGDSDVTATATVDGYYVLSTVRLVDSAVDGKSYEQIRYMRR